MSIDKKYEKLIEASYLELETLKREVTQLEDIRKNIENLIGSNNELPKIFEDKFKKIIQLSEDYSNSLGLATKNYLEGNNTLFTSKLNELSDKTKDLQEEISRLVNTDVTKLFQDLQKLFIDQTREDLATELKKFDDKSADLQIKIDELRKQVERLENIDLEEHFDKLQKTLSEIFGAINAINITLTAITYTLNSIAQSLGSIQNAIDTNHKETKLAISLLSDSIVKHLSYQDTEAKRNTELLESKIKSLAEQNELLNKEVEKNRIIQIVGLTITLIILIFVAVKQ
jgi:hypothetical protein